MQSYHSAVLAVYRFFGGSCEFSVMKSRRQPIAGRFVAIDLMRSSRHLMHREGVGVVRLRERCCSPPRRIP